MKKILFVVMAVVAIGFTACGNKAQQGETVDSAAIVDSLAGEAAQGIIDQLNTQIEAGDTSLLMKTLNAAKEKIAELLKSNPEVAKEYVAKVQTYLKDNAEKVKAVAGENAAVTAAVSALTETDPETIVNGILQTVGQVATDAKEAAEGAAAAQAGTIKDAAQQQVDAVKGAAQQQVDAAKQAAAAAQEAAKKQAEDAKAAAKKSASDAVDNAAAAAKSKLGL